MAHLARHCPDEHPFSARPYRSKPTILDALREHKITRSRGRRDPSIPQGGSRPSPRPPASTTYYTRCRNGGRRVPAYYIGGQRVTALGLPPTEWDRAAMKRMGCRGSSERPQTPLSMEHAPANDTGHSSTAQSETPPPKPTDGCHPKAFPLKPFVYGQLESRTVLR